MDPEIKELLKVALSKVLNLMRFLDGKPGEPGQEGAQACQAFPDHETQRKRYVI